MAKKRKKRRKKKKQWWQDWRVWVGVVLATIIILNHYDYIDLPDMDFTIKLPGTSQQPQQQGCTNRCAMTESQQPYPDCRCYDPNPTPSDYDGDGVPDAQDPDDDNDGYTDAEEQAAGSNPTDPNSIPQPVYTCSGSGYECGGTCPPDYDYCGAIEFTSGGYISCVCMDVYEQEIHPDWKPGGKFHVPGDPIPNPLEYDMLAMKELVVENYPAEDLYCNVNSDCPSDMKCWASVHECRYTCRDSDPNDDPYMLGWCIDVSKTFSDAENYFRTDRCYDGVLVQDNCQPDGSYKWADGSQVYHCEPSNYGECGCQFGVCTAS